MKTIVSAIAATLMVASMSASAQTSWLTQDNDLIGASPAAQAAYMMQYDIEMERDRSVNDAFGYDMDDAQRFIDNEPLEVASDSTLKTTEYTVWQN